MTTKLFGKTLRLLFTALLFLTPISVYAQSTQGPVTMGAGASDRTTQRVVTATDSQINQTTTDGYTGGSRYVVIAGQTPGGMGNPIYLPANVSANGNLVVEISTSAATVVTLPVGGSAGSNNGVTGCYIQTTASTNSTNCRNLVTNFFGIRAVNTSATLAYLRLYNASTAPTCSSATNFIETIPIPANSSGAGIQAIAPWPVYYGSGLGFCVTGGGTSTDNTNAPAGVYIALFWK